MTDKGNKEQKKEEPKTIKDISTLELKALAFDKGIVIQQQQQEYQIILAELDLRNKQV